MTVIPASAFTSCLKTEGTNPLAFLPNCPVLEPHAGWEEEKKRIVMPSVFVTLSTLARVPNAAEYHGIAKTDINTQQELYCNVAENKLKLVLAIVLTILRPDFFFMEYVSK